MCGFRVRGAGVWMVSGCCVSVNSPEWCMVGVCVVREGCVGVWVAYGCLAEWCGVSMVEGKGEGEGKDKDKKGKGEGEVNHIGEGMCEGEGKGKGKCEG